MGRPEPPPTSFFEPVARFRERLAAGETLVGVSMALADPQASEALADSVDFLWYDQEHAALGPEVLRAHLLAARSRRTPGFVRVPGSGACFLKPVLDAGASGVVVPQVRSAAEVRQVVLDCRYPPQGQRGFGPLVPTLYGRQGGPDYVERANREVFVAVMIETAEALAEIAHITAVPGLDSVVIGPWDLSGSLGVLGQVESPPVVSAMAVIVAAAQRAGVWVGAGMGADPDYALTLAGRGVQWLQVGGDCGYLVRSAEQIVHAVRRGAPP
ncbi:MAG: aldolase/citrate lyase family protein [Candidatus Latescibacterota bacterium]